MGRPNSGGSRVSFPALPCILTAAPLSPSPYTHPGFHLSSLSISSSSWGMLDPIPDGHDMLALRTRVGGSVSLDLSFLIYKMGTVLIPASPS